MRSCRRRAEKARPTSQLGGENLCTDTRQRPYFRLAVYRMAHQVGGKSDRGGCFLVSVGHLSVHARCVCMRQSSCSATMGLRNARLDVPWYARRHAGPDMITTSPDRRRIGTGSKSRVSPPMRKIAAFPRLPDGQTIHDAPMGRNEADSRDGYKGRSRAHLGAIDVRHECVLCFSKDQTRELD